jgi:hypothetical protein
MTAVCRAPKPMLCLVLGPDAQATDVTHQLSMLPAGATAADKLHLLALVSFTRAVGTAWLLPMADLYVRCKLNIIGELLQTLANAHQLQQRPVTTGHWLLTCYTAITCRAAPVLAREACRAAHPSCDTCRASHWVGRLVARSWRVVSTSTSSAGRRWHASQAGSCSCGDLPVLPIPPRTGLSMDSTQGVLACL